MMREIEIYCILSLCILFIFRRPEKDLLSRNQSAPELKSFIEIEIYYGEVLVSDNFFIFLPLPVLFQKHSYCNE